MPTFERTYGVHLLETITKGMYSEPLHCVREYIQNSYDSIRDARRKGTLADDEGKVVLYIDKESRSLHIRDNGTGLSPDVAVTQLGDLGNSKKALSLKSAGQNAGFRGIGRMGGISYCTALQFTTSDGTGEKLEVRFDAAKINELTRVGQRPKSIEQALNETTVMKREKEVHGERYFEVLMEGITEESSPFLDEQRLENYLAQVAPVHHDPGAWSFERDIMELAEAAGHLESLEAIHIEIQNDRGMVPKDIRRPFKNGLIFKGRGQQNPQSIRVRSIEPLPSEKYTATGWWGWIAKHDRLGGLRDIPYAGLRFRMHNIEIGGQEIIRELFQTSSLAAWCFGEIHITGEGVTPNAQRSTFEKSEQWDRIQKELRQQVEYIEKDIRKESTERNSSPDKVIKESNRILEKTNNELARPITSDQAKQDLMDKLQKVKNKIKKSANKRNLSPHEKKRLETTEEAINDAEKRVQVRKPTVDAIPAHLNEETRSVVAMIYKILKESINSKTYTRIKKAIDKELQQKRTG